MAILAVAATLALVGCAQGEADTDPEATTLVGDDERATGNGEEPLADGEPDASDDAGQADLPEPDGPSGSDEPEAPNESGETTSKETVPPGQNDVADQPSLENQDEPAARSDDESVDPAPRFFTLSTPSGRYELAVGDSATIELPPHTPQPTASGKAVLLIPVSPLAATGTKQWELRAVEKGTTTIDVDAGSDEASWTIVVPG